MSQPRSDLDVFTYGTLVVPEVMEAVAGKSFPSTPAILEGYGAFLVEGECFPGITATSGGTVPGLLYLGVDPATVKLLDRFEGELYERKRVAVRSDPLGLMSAQAYVVKADAKERLTTEEWDVDTFRKEHLEEWLEVCATFHDKGKR